jgi:hypothetical protein
MVIDSCPSNYVVANIVSKVFFSNFVILEIWRSIPNLEKLVIFTLEKHVSQGKSPFYVQKKRNFRNVTNPEWLIDA